MILISALSFVLFCLNSLVGFVLYPKNLCFGAMNQPFQITLGIVSTCNLLLFIACFTAVTPLIGTLLYLALFLYCLKSGFLKQWWYKTQSELPWLCIASIASSIVTLLPLSWSDTHYYHYPLLKWISSYGIVQGIGLIDPTYSHTAGWFALFAPFDTGIFSDRLGTAGGALTLGLFLYSVCRLPHRILGMGAFLILTILSMTHNIFASLSPDPFAQWIGLLCISLWIYPNSQRQIQEKVILVLLALSICVRVTLLPVFLLFTFWYIFNHGLKKPVFLFWIVILLIPAVYSTFLSGGCPLYPLSWFCADWGVKGSGAYAMQMHIREIVIWCDKIPIDSAPALSWIPGWFFCEYNQIPTGLLILGVVVLPYRRMESKDLQALFCSLVMVVFMLLTAPALRYGAIWFMTPFLIALQLRFNINPSILTYKTSIALLTLTVFMFWNFPPLHENLFRIQNPKNNSHLWLVPNKALDFLQPSDPRDYLWNSFKVNSPWLHNQAPRCSSLPPPCASHESLIHLRPIDPNHLLGFQNKE